MTSRNVDVIDRCVDVNQSSPTRHFYFMTTLDDDLDQPVIGLYDETIGVNGHQKQTEDDRPNNDEAAAAATAADGDEEKPRELYLRQEQGRTKPKSHKQRNNRNDELRLQQRYEDDSGHKDDEDDEDDLNDVTICQSTISTPAKHSLQQPPSETLRLHSLPNSTLVISETAALVQNIPEVFRPLCSTFTTQPESVKESRIQQQYHSLPMTTNNQPISDENEPVNEVRFDRKLIDEIDAVMAQNGYRAWTSPLAPGNHMSTTGNDSQGHMCNVEDSETKSGGN